MSSSMSRSRSEPDTDDSVVSDPDPEDHMGESGSDNGSAESVARGNESRSEVG
jgi:hypothetical protein